LLLLLLQQQLLLHLLLHLQLMDHEVTQPNPHALLGPLSGPPSRQPHSLRCCTAAAGLRL
jgi:hypothetical protein